MVLSWIYRLQRYYLSLDYELRYFHSFISVTFSTLIPLFLVLLVAEYVFAGNLLCYFYGGQFCHPTFLRQRTTVVNPNSCFNLQGFVKYIICALMKPLDFWYPVSG